MMNVMISGQTRLSDSVVKLTFSPLDGETLPDFKAGAHIDVRVNETMVRQYSLCSAASVKDAYSIAVLRDANSRGGSAHIHQNFQAGQIVQISPPRNLFELKEHAGHVLLIGAGIGITPLISMALALTERKHSFTLCYLHKPAEQVAFRDELLQSEMADNVVFIPAINRRQTQVQLEEIIGQYHTGQGLYTCGPAGFMDTVFELAVSQHWPESALHKEMFQNEITRDGTDAPFTLHLIQSQKVIQVNAGQSALEALDEAGIEVDASCEQGVCGTCLLRVVEGRVDHRDAYLTEDEKQQHNQFTPCCSRAFTSSLSIDL